MKRWEYLQLRAESVGRDGSSFRHSHYNYVTDEALDTYGAEGWEVVAASGDAEGCMFALLKREIPEKAGG